MESNLSGDLTHFYEVLLNYKTHLNDTRKIRIGAKGICRFCDNTDPKQFRNESHTIPEFLGNKCITNLDECDNCNRIFSAYESELSKFLSPYLTMGQIRGKRGIPKIKGSGFEFKRDAKRISVSVSNQEPDVILWNPLTDTIKLKASMPNHQYRPRYAYKALCKIALSILPEAEIKNFIKLRQWILKPEDNEDFHYLECKLAQTQIYHHLPLISVSVLKRREDSMQVPYMIFILMASTFCLQIDLMSDEKDNHIDCMEAGQVKISMNTFLGNGDKEIRIDYEDETLLNWASNEKTRILLNSITFNIPRSDFSKSIRIEKNQGQ